MRIIIISLLATLTALPVMAQRASELMSLKTYGDAHLLFLTDQQVLALTESKAGYVLQLFDKGQKQTDEQILPKPKAKNDLAISKLGADRVFLSDGKSAYNFRVDQGKIIQTHKKPFPKAPRTAVKTMFFLDGEKTATVFLNLKQQYNVYIDSAGTQLAKNETFNTSHIGNLAGFAKRKEGTPDFVHAYQHQELFFHMPADVSILSIDLKNNKIDIGLLYMEYNQSYVFRRYYDQVTGQRYALKQDKQRSWFFETSSFGVLAFTQRLNSLESPLAITLVPEAVVNGKVLHKRVQKGKNGQYQHDFYLTDLAELN